ncbi:MAG: hypothetical protein AAF603_10830 [Pseudomonadota bacterium]
MATTDNHEETSPYHNVEEHKKTYQWMMDFGFTVGLPVGGAITMFVMLMLLGSSFFVGVFLSFLTWLGLLGISKTFFVH